jgi:hypothetical protein
MLMFEDVLPKQYFSNQNGKEINGPNGILPAELKRLLGS